METTQSPPHLRSEAKITPELARLQPVQRIYFIMPGSVRLNLTGKLPKEGRFRPMRAGRQTFSVARRDGQFHVTASLCPHKDLPLGKGRLQEGRIVCPWHSWCFDPATGQQPKGRVCLKTYPAQEEDGEIFVILA